MLIADIEADGFLEELTKMHCFVGKHYKKSGMYVFCNLSELSEEFKNEYSITHNVKWYEKTELTTFLEQQKAIAIHNLFGYDLPALKKLGFIESYDLTPDHINNCPVRLIDTLSMSRTLYPDRPMPTGCPHKVRNPVTGKMDTVGSHGLMAWGYRVANAKPEVHDWRDQPLEVYTHRCIEDVIINELVMEELIKESKDTARGDKVPKIGLKSGWEVAMKVANKNDFLMCKQEEDGIMIDQPAMLALINRIDKMMSGIEKEVEPKLPRVPLTESETPNFPANPFDKDDNIGHHGYNWLEKQFGFKVNREALFAAKTLPKRLFKPNRELYPAALKFLEKAKEAGYTLTDDPVEDVQRFSQLSKADPLGERQSEGESLLRAKTMPDLTKELKLSNQDGLKKYLVTEGWIPTLWRTKDATKDSNKVARDTYQQREVAIAYIDDVKNSPYKAFIENELGFKFTGSTNSLLDKVMKKARYLPTSPKLKDERGNLCPNLERLDGEMAKEVVLWLSLRNRRSVLKAFDESKETGWANNPRLSVDGRIGQGNSGLTNTKRYKHRTIVNLPKASDEVVLGKEMRSLLIAPKGSKILGYDGSNLEGFVAACYAWIYDGGAYLESLSGDPHTTNAEAYSLAAGRKVSRGEGKSLTYATLYGAQAPKIAAMLGLSKEKGQSVIDAFWNTNLGLKKCKEALEKYWEATGKRYIRGILGDKIYTRSKHSLLNALFQNCGSAIMFLAGCYMYDMLRKEGYPLDEVVRLAFVHDEYQYQVDNKYIDEYVFDFEEEAKAFELENKLLSNVREVDGKYYRWYSRIGELGNISLNRAGKFLNMPVLFEAAYDVGNNFAETH